MIAARPQHRCLQQSQSARASRASGERSVHIGRYPFVDSKSKKTNSTVSDGIPQKLPFIIAPYCNLRRFVPTATHATRWVMTTVTILTMRRAANFCWSRFRVAVRLVDVVSPCWFVMVADATLSAVRGSLRMLVLLLPVCVPATFVFVVRSRHESLFEHR